MNLEDPLLIHIVENVVVFTETTNNAKLLILSLDYRYQSLELMYEFLHMLHMQSVNAYVK